MGSTPKYTVEDPTFNKVHTRYQNYAVFSQLDYAWTDQLTLTGSIRMDSDSRYTPQFNPRLGFSWHAFIPLRFFGAWGTSFLAPSPHFIYEKWGESSWSSYFRPNPQLQPEKLSTYELGMDIAAHKNSTLKLLGFYTVGNNLTRIVDNAGTGLPSFNGNVASSKSYGMQAIVGQQWNNGLNVNFDYTLTLGEQDAEKKTNGKVGLTNIPEHMIKGNVAYTLEQLSIRFTGRWFDKIGTHESNMLYAGKTAQGALIFDSNIHYGGLLNAAKWSVDFGVDNLFDRKYYTIPIIDNLADSLPRQPQETRKLYLTLGLSF